ncbi:MAG: hemerythrin domain-containing protein [Bacteroidales bacterium]
MYQTHKTYIKPESELSGLIFDNPSLILMLEHFNLDFTDFARKTVSQICREKGIGIDLFISIANLYNGFNPSNSDLLVQTDAFAIIGFLSRSHSYYKQEKYPEIQMYINKLYEHDDSGMKGLVERFFDDYFNEVIEHLDYEENVAFPYFYKLIGFEADPANLNSDYSAGDYREHHTDIESKLTDLKNLFIKHIPIKGEASLRRKLILSLFELETDLSIHSQIEESILIPLIRKIESNKIA